MFMESHSHHFFAVVVVCPYALEYFHSSSLHGLLRCPLAIFMPFQYVFNWAVSSLRKAKIFTKYLGSWIYIGETHEMTLIYITHFSVEKHHNWHTCYGFYVLYGGLMFHREQYFSPKLSYLTSTFHLSCASVGNSLCYHSF